MADWSNLGLIVCCFLLGMLLKRLRVVPPDAPMVLNRFVIYISLPALTLLLVHRLELGGQVLFPVLMPWLVFLGSAALFFGIGRMLGWDVPTRAAIALTAGLGNTSFLGYPLIETFYGKEALQIGLLVDQPGSFLVLSTLGIMTASAAAGGRFDFRGAVRRILVFPPFLAALLAGALRFVAYPDWVTTILERLGGTLVPLALVSVGMQLTLDRERLRAEAGPLCAGLFYKLILAPLLIALLYIGAFGARGLTIQVSVFQAAMAPMITAGILASEYHLNPRLASLMIGIGIPLSLVSLPIWWWILSRCGV